MGKMAAERGDKWGPKMRKGPRIPDNCDGSFQLGAGGFNQLLVAWCHAAGRRFGIGSLGQVPVVVTWPVAVAPVESAELAVAFIKHIIGSVLAAVPLCGTPGWQSTADPLCRMPCGHWEPAPTLTMLGPMHLSVLL